MRIALHSDLHLEGNALPKDFLSDQNFDVLVLAGDIVTDRTVVSLADIKEKAGKKPVLYIPGNHEFYRGDIASTTEKLKEMCVTVGIIYADKCVVRLDDVAFICAIGWSDLESFSEFTFVDKVLECSTISDFYAIKNHTPHNMVDMAKADKKFIETSLKVLRDDNFSGRVVVVTHFAPTEAHGNERFAPNMISSYFSNAWEGIMYEYKPHMWIYGHTHGSVERDVYETKVVCNQRGYGKECQFTYNPNRIVEV